MLKKLLTLIIMSFLLTACSTNTIDTTQQTNPTEKKEEIVKTVKDYDQQLNEDTKDKQDEATKLNVHYIDVGQADATLFEYKDKNKSYNILFDTGDWKSNDTIHYLQTQNISELDLIIISHPDADHIGQLTEIINTFSVKEVWMSGNESTSDIFQQSIEAILARDIDYYEPRTGDQFAVGPMDIQIIHPSQISGNSNEESLSVLFTYGTVKFLFTGDANRKAELQMIHTGIDLHADVIQLGHHGSNTSNDPTFIKAVQPSIAIYSAGHDNQYGHPHEEVVSQIKNAGIELYGTDVHGTILITSDGKEFEVKTGKDGTVSPINTKQTKKEQEGAKKNPEKATSDITCIDINHASYEEIQQINHIGPERADLLIEGRPYHSIDELISIRGIGPARIQDIKEQNLACVK